MAGIQQSLLTPRLRLVPIGPRNAADLWLVHNDDAVAPWYDGRRPSRHDGADAAMRISESWRLHGVHKWIPLQDDSDRGSDPQTSRVRPASGSRWNVG